MFRFIALTFIYFIGIVAGNEETPQTVVSRIFGGRPINITEAPYQVALLLEDEYICGGSYVAPRIVLTAAHCVHKYFAKLLTVRLGSDEWKARGTKVQVSASFSHPYFNATSLDYDAAVLVLTQNVPQSTTIQFIKLSSSGPSVGQLIKVTGWGGTFQGLTVTDNLQMVIVRVTDQVSCNNMYRSQRTVTSRMFCAGSRTGDSCKGDSGSPAVYNGIQVGIVSWGVGCGQPFYPGVYAKISALYAWLYHYV